MPDLYHDIQFSLPFTFDPPNEPIYGTDMQMFVTVKNPIGDPVPTAPVFDATMNLESTVNVTGESDEATTRTTIFGYSFNPAWTAYIDRQSDAVSPFPVLPTNVYNFEYKDMADEKQGFTSRGYFVTA